MVRNLDTVGDGKLPSVGIIWTVRPFVDGTWRFGIPNDRDLA